MANPQVSMETALDEEMKEVLAQLEKNGKLEKPSIKRTRSSASGGPVRPLSPFTMTGHPQASPILSMLNVDDYDLSPRKTSLTGINGVGMNIPPRQGSVQSVRSMLDVSPSPHSSPAPVRSMLDVDTPDAHSKSAASSPTEDRKVGQTANGLPHRSLSDASTTPPTWTPRYVSSLSMLEPVYKVPEYRPPNHAGPTSPKRETLAGRKTSAMAEVLRGGSISLLGPPPAANRDRGRHSIASTGISTSKSNSPGRLSLRSKSPHPSSDSSKFVLKDGRVMDMNAAHRRLSDAGVLAGLGDQKQRRRTDSGSNGSRLDQGYASMTAEDAVVDSSEDDSISDDEKPRGRNHDYKETNVTRAAKSQMAAAEEERKQIAAQVQKHKIRSLLDPEIKITAAGGDRSMRLNKAGVHPNTSFDEGTSGLSTPVDSDAEEDFSDIKRAQKLSINMTPIISTPLVSRCVRTIFRGDFAKMQQEARDNQRRIRKYLVATDLSDEAAHAMEWTMGTVLRDGDTLLAIYCVDEETGISNAEGSGDEHKMKEQIAAVDASTKPSASTPVLGPVIIPSPLGPGYAPHSASASPMGRERGKAEQERFRAVQDITERVSRLLRKTRLQVKVVIEVIHCKSPKHLITEVIDYISPTMVILGSRGQSQLKGVILGSFSNYLVTKSSVPVMVARKRLRKHTKYKRPAMRLANNLANPAVKTLATAKID